MRYTEHDDVVRLERIDDALRKPVEAAPANPTLQLLPCVGEFREAVHDGGDFNKKLSAKPRSFTFVVAEGGA
jgi:hypothetical protein